MFSFDAKRPKGRWRLVRMKPRAREKTVSWPPIKAEDQFARGPANFDLQSLEDTSVLPRTNGELIGADAIREDHKGRARFTEKRSAKAPGGQGALSPGRGDGGHTLHGGPL